jgi:hypothetical protein
VPHFFNIAPGEEKTAPGLRVRVSDNGERVWMHGKWLDLGDDHAVVWVDEGQAARFIRSDGSVLRLGDFPAWVCRSSSGRRRALAAMFNIGQFSSVELTG